MTTPYQLFIFLLSAVFLPPLQEAVANNDVKIDDIFSKQDKSEIVDVIEHSADQVAETVIQRALEGHVKKPNSTIVADPQQPHKENYSVSFTFKEAPDSRKRPQYDGGDADHDFSGQPCGIGFVTLVSDDGCTISITNDKGKKEEWLKESGKGHDISKGRRDYPNILMPGTHTFDIEYSQTYYNPAPGKKDMDGITLFVTPVVVDISVRKQNAPKENSRVLLVKGESVEMALNKDMLGQQSKFKDLITWETCRLRCGTNGQANYETQWNKIGEGTTCTYQCNTPGIYRVRAKINGKIFTYTRRETAFGAKKANFLEKGDPDCIGIVNSINEKYLIESAITHLMEKTFAKATPWYDPQEVEDIIKSLPGLLEEQKQLYRKCSLLRRQVKIYGHNDFSNNLLGEDGEGQSKCNLFIYYHARSCGLEIPTISKPTMGIPPIKFCAPLVQEWIQPTRKIGSWKWMNAKTTLPEPGWFSFDESHCAIIDYDGAGISGGTLDVNKTLYLSTPIYFRKHE